MPEKRRETRVGVRELKTRLSEHLRRVKSGAVIVVTEHGSPVARIVPNDSTAVERFDRLVSAGILTGSGQLMPRRPVGKVRGGASVADLVGAGRD